MHARDILERSILGGILLKPDAIALIPALEPDDFADLRCKAVWSAMRNLEAFNRPIDGATVAAELERDDRLDAIGGWVFLGELAANVPTAENVVEYCTRLRDLALVTRIASAAGQLQEEAKRGTTGGAELLAMCWEAFAKLGHDEPDRTLEIGALVKERMRELSKVAEDREHGSSKLTGFPTGIAGLDEKMGGWQPGIVQIVAARPAMGKSSVALATMDACSAAGVGAHLFSLEDSRQSHADRAISRESTVPATNLRTADLTRDQFSRIGPALNTLAKRRGWIVDDRGGLTVDEIIRSVRRHAKRNKTKVVVVDYAQVVAKRRTRRDLDENEHLTEVVNALASAAKDGAGIAYVLMSQLNRELEKRPDKRPMLADLRGSGSLEQVAKIVIGLYRGIEYCESPQKWIDWSCRCPAKGMCEHAPTQEDWERTMQLLVLKNNNGETGPVFARWNAPTTRVD